MPDCSRQAQKVADTEAEIADLQPDPGSGGGPVHHPPPQLAALHRALAQAEAALAACLNQPVVSTLFPRFLVTNLLYNPPGIGSETTYGAGSSAGVTTQVTNSFRPGLSIATSGGFFGNGLDASVAFSAGPKNGNSIEIKKEQTSTLAIQSQQDVVDHSRDLFFIWTNIRVDAAQKPDQSISLSVGIQGAGQAMDIVSLTGAELRDQTLIPTFKKAQLKALTPDDYRAIAGLNPLMAGAAPDPGRYRFLQKFQVTGPDQAGDGIPGLGTGVSDEHIAGSIMGLVTQLNVGVTLQTGFNLGVCNASLSVGLTFEWDYETSKNITAGTKEEAAVTLRSATVGYHKVVAVYQDMMFKTLAFVAEPDLAPDAMASLTGTVLDAQSRPIFNRRVDVVLPDGVRHTTFTNSQGVYRLFLPAQGQGEVRVDDIVKTVALTAGPIDLAFQPGAE